MFASIVVALDGSDCARRALAIGLDLARVHGSRLTIATVVDPIEACAPAMDPFSTIQPFLEALTEDAHRLIDEAGVKAIAAGVPADGLVLEGAPIATLLDLARRCRADLITIGSHGRKGMSRFIAGSVAEGVTRDAPCPTLIVHDPR